VGYGDVRWLNERGRLTSKEPRADLVNLTVPRSGFVAQGHDVGLVPAQYVRPFGKDAKKNDFRPLFDPPLTPP
jgi:hypothetical protein